MWNDVAYSNLTSIPKIGDYGVRLPGFVTFDPRRMGRAPKYVYTCQDYWLSARGQQDQMSQFQQLAQQLVERDEFCGAGYSWGDERIVEIANGNGIGSMTNWISYGTNHHLTFVAEQLANLSDS